MGELRKRGNLWWVRYYRNGRRHEESSGSTKKGDAERLLKIREGDIARGVPIAPSVGRIRFDEAAAEVVLDYRVNGKKTADQVERRIRLHLEPFFGGRRLVSISSDDARAYIGHRQEAGAANATINRELAVLKRAFRLAEQSGKVLHRPHIPMLRENNVRRGFFGADQFEAVRAALPPELRGMVTFAYFTAWRIASEILPLKWARVDRKARTIRLEPGSTKNKNARTLPYGQLPELVDLIERQWVEHKRLQREGVICPHVFHRNGKPITDFRGAWKKACKTAGVPGMEPHDFRRTAIRNLVRAGVPDTVAMEISGHKTRSVFDRYNITSEDDKADALGRLATVGTAGHSRGHGDKKGTMENLNP